MALIAAALFPLLAMLGGGIDMGRGYLSQSRLQQACDSGVLAARKRLGTQVVIDANVPTEVTTTGHRFFNLNFQEGAYGSANRQFQLALESDYSITGEASVEVPTTIMKVFGYETLTVNVECTAQINMANTDIMMVLDTTGSMLGTNTGDTQTKIAALQAVVKSFHAQLEGNKPPETRIRYGFVPYSTNVNVGHLLADDWMVDEWEYNYRTAKILPATEERDLYETNWTYQSGTKTPGEMYFGEYCPESMKVRTEISETEDGDWTSTLFEENGTDYECTYSGGNWQVTPVEYENYQILRARRVIGTETVNKARWVYDRMDFGLDFLDSGYVTSTRMGGDPYDPTFLTVAYKGCIEERETYEIGDYDNVDLTRALDLDLDLVPDSADEDTQWRPMLHRLSYLRAIKKNGKGTWTQAKVQTKDDFINSDEWGYSACPSPARRLAEMTTTEMAAYIDNVDVWGSTYHDIGMIWGGRLISPTGLFAAENADVSSSRPTSRHLIFLTDGETAPLDVSYASYGIEPIDTRRWSDKSSLSLTETVEKRFAFACEEVKKKNVTVWVISFGTAANPVMETCAGGGHYFVADDAAELQDTFTDIANRIGELRVTQ